MKMVDRQPMVIRTGDPATSTSDSAKQGYIVWDGADIDFDKSGAIATGRTFEFDRANPGAVGRNIADIGDPVGARRAATCGTPSIPPGPHRR